jgi:hypothetical protein
VVPRYFLSFVIDPDHPCRQQLLDTSCLPLGEPELAPLFSDQTERELRTHWQEIQKGFVNEPRQAVERADQLVAKLMQQLAQSFSDQRNNLERQWDQAEKISTEDLRMRCGDIGGSLSVYFRFSNHLRSMKSMLSNGADT